MTHKKIAIALIFMTITGGVIGCSNSDEISLEEGVTRQESQTILNEDNDKEYKERYTAVICRQAIVNVSELFYARQKNMPKNEAIVSYIESKGSLENPIVGFYAKVLDDAYKKPIYYPEIENDPFFTDQNPKADDELKKQREIFEGEQYDKCLDELTPYTKENHAAVFGSAYVPKS